MIYLIILFAVLTRFIPHMPNLAPVTALAIFGAVYLPKKQALVIPLAVRVISDIFLGFFSWPLMVAVYASHLVGFGLGLWVKKSSTDFSGRFAKLFGSAVVSALVFFLVTNFAFFYAPQEYAHNLSGVLLAYYNGLPFLRGTLVGDTAYTLALAVAFEGATYLAGKKLFSKKPQVNAA